MKRVYAQEIKGKVGRSGIFVAKRLMVGGVYLFLALASLWLVGFSGQEQFHNGAHDTRHSLGFPCH